MNIFKQFLRNIGLGFVGIFAGGESKQLQGKPLLPPSKVPITLAQALATNNRFLNNVQIQNFDI